MDNSRQTIKWERRDEPAASATIEFGSICAKCGCSNTIRVMAVHVVYECYCCGNIKRVPRKTAPTPPLGGYGGYKSNEGLLRGLVMGVAIIAGGWAFLTWLLG